MARRKKQNRRQRRQSAQNRQRWIKWIILLLVGGALASLVVIAIPKKPKMPTGPTFTKQGELFFLDGENGDTLQRVDIEVKSDALGRANGMMWRRSMKENQAMLFIMERAEPQTFWMRNTYIPLDIIFVDEQLRILNVRANAQPQSLSPQPSSGDALYVVEVVGGFCGRHNIAAGDKIQYRLNN